MHLHTRCFLACGLRVSITAPAEILGGLDFALLSPAVFVGRPDRSFVVGRDGGPEAVRSLNDDIVWFVAQHARTRVFVHAGVVGVDGAAIVIPGRSRSGKSSLVAALVGAGAVYYSDEYAIVDRAGRVHPYARPLSVRPYDGGDPHEVTAADLGGTTGSAPLHVGAVVISTYRPGVKWRAVQRPSGRGALAMIDNAIAVRSHSTRVLASLAAAAAGALVYDSARGDADDTARRILRAVNAARIERCEPSR